MIQRNHVIERVNNLMYDGCEPHWHCIQCDDYWPFHCYGKRDLEQMECRAYKEKETVPVCEKGTN